MSEFKLLAIRTGKISETKIRSGKAKDFLKVLKPDTLYQFYNEYQFLDGKNKVVNDSKAEVHSIRFKPQIPENLYQLKWNKNKENEEKVLDINISAVVGMNGAGKSTLLELFFAAIYLMWKDPKIESNKIDFEKNNFNPRKTLDMLNKVKEEFGQLSDKEINDFPFLQDLIEQLNQVQNVFKDKKIRSLVEKREQEIKERDYRFLLESLDLEIFYTMNGLCYRSKVFKNQKNEPQLIEFHSKSDKQLTLKNKRDFIVDYVLNDEEVKLSDHFFYTVAISYSQYGLNSKLEGNWLQETFHKNDSYQMPLVVNPMRTDGQIDFNREDELVKQRMLSNLLEFVSAEKLNEPNLRDLTRNKKATKLIIRFDDRKYIKYQRRYKNGRRFKNVFIQKLYSEYTNDNSNLLELINKKDKKFKAAYYYLHAKLFKIGATYSRYYELNILRNEDKDEELITNLINDGSHITFKLKQTLNFLRFEHIFESIENKPTDIQKLSREIYNKKKVKSTIEFLPPPIFDVEVIVADMNGKESNFELMSSGEKQKVHVMNSLVYHLINLNSVSKNGLDDPDFNKYKHINILFDEVEQYFHPDLQRTFIADLLDFISKIQLENINKIKGINFLFATHSPFILSDISAFNTLRLKVEETKNKELKSIPQPLKSESFGANIHKLLADDFFLESGFMGQFAKKTINDTFKELQLSKKNEINSTDEVNKIRIEQTISMVGEPIIKQQLEAYYRKKFGTSNYQDWISNEIIRLQKLQDKDDSNKT